MAEIHPSASFSVPAQKLPTRIKASSRAFSASSSPSPSPPPSNSQPVQPTPTTKPPAKCSASLPAPSLYSIVPSNTPDQHSNPRTKTRRRIYLSRHPSYCLSPDLELSHPLLYDRLVRRFQTAGERETEGKKRGYARVLEAGLWRGEAVRGMGGYNEAYARVGRGIIGEDERENGGPRSGLEERGNGTPSEVPSNEGGLTTPSRNDAGIRGAGRLEDSSYIPTDRIEGMRMWREEMEARFLRGEDEDFAYREVDENEEFDDWDAEQRDKEDIWFAEEDERWIGDGEAEGAKKPTGETGIQDF